MVVFSKFQTIPTTCVELIHPWTNSCSSALTGLAIHEIQESARIYVTVYLLALLMRGKIPAQQDLSRTFFGILQSSAFLSCHGFSFTMFSCLLRRIFGGYNLLTVGFWPAFLSSYVSIFVERPSRRSLLCLYVTNVASETLFNMAKSRNMVKRIPHSEVAIFAISMTILLYNYRGIHEKKDSIYSLIRFLIGPYEEYNKELVKPSENINIVTIPKNKNVCIVNKIINKTVNTLNNINKKIKDLPKHESCVHPNSCVYYTLKSFIKLFSIGYSLQIGLRILLQIKRVAKNPKLILKQLIHRDAFNLGLFLGGFSGIYKMISCILRRISNKDSKSHAIPAGLLAGLMFIFFPDNSIALYIMWKSLQIMYKDQVDKGNLPNIPGGGIILYCLSTAILFHAAIVEPNNLRPSYWKFLHNISGGRMAAIQRQHIDVFGYESNRQVQETILLTKTKIVPIKY